MKPLATELVQRRSSEPDVNRVLDLVAGAATAREARPHLFRVALGSAAEVAACLEVAVALGYLEAPAVAPALELVDRARAMTYRLANR